MKMKVERQFRFENKIVVEHRLICFCDNDGNCLNEGKCGRLKVRSSISNFLKTESARARELYFPDAPVSIRFIESHTPPLSKEELEEFRRTLHLVQKVQGRIFKN